MTPDEMRRAALLLAWDGTEEMRTLARLLREEADSQGWMDIATAPRDGTRVLLWRDWLSDDCAVCQWRQDICNWYSVGRYVFNGALLWRPLPPPPQGREEPTKPRLPVETCPHCAGTGWQD